MAMDLSLFDYELSQERIAQEPAEPRDASRLLVLDRGRHGWEDARFSDLPRWLRAGDCVVVNESRVIPARLLGLLEGEDTAVELLMVRALEGMRWEALVRPGRRLQVGARVSLAHGAARVTVLDRRAEGVRVVEIEAPWPMKELLERHGRPPLPPYIARHDAPKPEDWERYQTVYARPPGSIAAPTAGLHFTPALLERLAAAGVEIHPITLHVGPGTFRPIRTAAVEAHRLAPETAEVPAATAEAVNRARAEGRRVMAVGTTATRTLEWASDATGVVQGRSGEADLFICPGHRFRVVDALVTNFHLPRSSLLVLVSALAGRELILAAYAHAVAEGYRFYSYGDAMLIL
jgi:S-adenosylmethionine:tRNA ribosyltransferase-isomerase